VIAARSMLDNHVANPNWFYLSGCHGDPFFSFFLSFFL
jgi:hypothetical protein